MARKRKQKEGVVIPLCVFESIEHLPEESARVLMQAIRNYSQHGAAPDFTGNDELLQLWPLIKAMLDGEA